ncbi:MAG TPA: complex I NDUFA9 subunit family protein [Geminicoccaceae bacterium]|nr:complex I NDUFA9 subunit family protein [Geminicoccaceae bacterium]
MRNCLFTIFGGTGFIGRYVVQRLADRGARILVISRSPRTRGLHLQPLGAVNQIVVQGTDLDDEAALRRTVAGASGVINLIGILYETGRQPFAEVHGALPGRIAAAASAEGVPRLVHVSAIGADPNSTSAYARSKAEGERRVRVAFPAATILRPSIVIGPEDGFFNRFANLARFLPALPLIGGGKTRFQPVYVGDVAQAVVAALERDDCQGQTYELGGPKAYTFEELMRYMLQVVERRRLLVNVPFGLANLLARFLELLPEPPLTRDQVELLKYDNVVTPGTPGFDALGITPTPIELIVPDYLALYRPGPARIRSA